jgi:hypothetical protein
MVEEEEMLAALGLGFLGTILVGIASVIVVQLVRLVRARSTSLRHIRLDPERTDRVDPPVRQHAGQLQICCGRRALPLASIPSRPALSP